MSDVFREVDEDLRNEQMTRLWKRFGPYLIGAAVLVVAVVAGYKGWNWYTANRAAEAGLAFEQAVTEGLEGEHAVSIAELESLENNAPGKYPVLAKLAAAGVKARAGDASGAAADYDAIAATRGIDPEIANLARVQAGLLLVDTADRLEIVERMSPIAAGASPWRYTALEILGLAAYKADAINDAADLFRQIIADPQAPRGVRQRSQVMLALITPNETAAENPAQPPAEAAQ